MNERAKTAIAAAAGSVLTVLAAVAKGTQPAGSADNPLHIRDPDLVKWTAALVFATVALFVAGLFQWDQLRRASNQAESQLRVMEADQRPWIKSSVEIIGFRFTRDMNAEVDYSLDFRNIGKSPARNITNRIVASVIEDKSTLLNSINDEMTQCDLTKKESSNPENGTFLFPNESAPIGSVDAGTNHATASSSEYQRAFPFANKPMFKLVGCIAYQLSNDGDHFGFT